MHKIDPKIHLKKYSQDRSKTALRSRKRVPRPPRSSQDGPKTTREGSPKNLQGEDEEDKDEQNEDDEYDENDK